MIGYHFYLEYGTNAHKRHGIHMGTVIAKPTSRAHRNHNGDWECFAAVYDQPNSAVCTTSTTVEYLRETCKRIPEWRARQIHPRLFDWMEECERSAQND
jgi:hypothetical protein